MRHAVKNTYFNKYYIPEDEPSSSEEKSDPRRFRFFADPRIPLLTVFLGLYSPSDGSYSEVSCFSLSSSLSETSYSLSLTGSGCFFLGAGDFFGVGFPAGLPFFLGGGGGESSSSSSSSDSEGSSSSDDSFFFFFLVGVALALGLGLGLALGLG